MKSSELTQLTTAFTAVHTGIKGDALALKIKMFFAGLLVNELTEWHRDNIGETRGGDHALTASPLQAWLEQQLQITRSTAHRYRSFWRSISESTLHANAVKALNAWWIEHKPTLVLPEPTKAKGKTKASEEITTTQQARNLTLQATSTMLADDLQSLLAEADDLDLHTLFEKPIKDVTPEQIEKLQDQQKDEQLELALKFWGPQSPLQKRLAKKEYLHLPKPELEALATTLEEALHDLKDTLKSKR
jgi:hypothetical protein